MHADEIKDVVKEYLENPKAEYAVMIDGEWGSGKTYFLTHSLLDIMKTIDFGKEKIRKYAYVSLYGVKTVDDVSKELLYQFWGRKNQKVVQTADAVMDTASNVVALSIGTLSIDLKKLKEAFSKVDICNWIICFDDLERCCIPINEVLGFINRLVEHNKCKVIVLANEKEIGNINLNQRLEEKYQVLLFAKQLLKEPSDDIVSREKLQKEARELFGKDILYSSIREKAIGLTIKFEPEMDKMYSSIISEYGNLHGFKDYLERNKDLILKLFEDMKCMNLRTFIAAINSIQKVYNEMHLKKIDKNIYFEKMMEEFIKYIILFTICYRSDNSIDKKYLSSEIGYISFDDKMYREVRGFKLLEKYCMTAWFSDKEFVNVTSWLQREYEEKAKKEEMLKMKFKTDLAKALGELAFWWELDDEKVDVLIKQLREEIVEDKYACQDYPKIIARLLILEENEFEVGDMNSLIEVMINNIEKTPFIVEFKRYSMTFEDEPELQKKYLEYINKIKSKADDKKQHINSSEVSKCLEGENWAEKLCVYCDEHINEFLNRHGYIDLLDTDKLLEKLKSASPKEIYTVTDMFKKVYVASNINEFFLRDVEEIKKLKDNISKLELIGKNKPRARDTLTEYLLDVIQRLEKNLKYRM